MPIILARSGRLFWSFFRKLILCNDCRRNCWLSLTDCLFDIISSNWRIRICFPFIFSSDGHVICIESKICKMSIILPRSRSLFFWSSIGRTVFSDCCSLNFWFYMSQVRFVLSYCWVWICFPNIFSSNCHIVWVEPKIFKMTIILARSGRLFLRSFGNIIFSYNCRWYCWFN